MSPSDYSYWDFLNYILPQHSKNFWNIQERWEHSTIEGYWYVLLFKHFDIYLGVIFFTPILVLTLNHIFKKFRTRLLMLFIIMLTSISLGFARTVVMYEYFTTSLMPPDRYSLTSECANVSILTSIIFAFLCLLVFVIDYLLMIIFPKKKVQDLEKVNQE